MMRHTVSTIIGKSVRKAALIRGSGSALPGLVIDTIDPKFLTRSLEKLPLGVILISGTNGKTTTTKMVTRLLESQGLTVFTNPTGSNFTRGVTAAIIGAANTRGHLKADIAVLELDEAYAVHFVRLVKPTYCLLLNVMRDQLDRFGEIDKTAELLRTVAHSTTKGIVINRDDPRLSASTFVEGIGAPIIGYGVSPALRSLFPSDDTLRDSTHSQNAPDAQLSPHDVRLDSLVDHTATMTYDGSSRQVTLKLDGIYNVLNAVGAIALTRLVMADSLDEAAMLHALSTVTPAFGRGETIRIGEIDCQLILVKNPSGFRLGLKSFESKNHDTMIAINDDYADGRDMSWLWDVDFESLGPRIAITSGVRAYDMALRLQYDEISVDTVEPTVTTAIRQFLALPGHRPKRIYCTYTAMLAIRKELSNYAHVEKVQ